MLFLVEIATTCRTFILWSSPSYGNCYSFNFNIVNLLKHERGKASESVALPGPGYGLSLVLNIEQEQYGGISQNEGARYVKIILSGECCMLSLSRSDESQTKLLYVSTLLKSRVVVHARDNLPLIDDAGINVEPNTATDIAIKHVRPK